MASFNNLTILLKQKWLQFFQVNRYWIRLHMEVESVYTPDGGRRPPSSLILGVVNALEPQLADLMVPEVDGETNLFRANCCMIKPTTLMLMPAVKMAIKRGTRLTRNTCI